MTHSPRVLIFGTFDHLHPGHRYFLAEAGKHGELYVVVARDANVLRIKGRLPEQSEAERLRKVCDIVPTAYVMLGNIDDFLRPVREVAPECIVLGHDQLLPPGVRLEDLPCPVKRLPAFKAELFKSSRLRDARLPGKRVLAKKDGK